jgi:ubiquinone/menaquinone biosynthesis C-methylase UbiE
LSETAHRNSSARYPKFIRKMYRGLFPLWRELVRKELKGYETALDLGCGNGADSPLKNADLIHSLGVDIFEPYLEQCRKAGIHTDYALADIREVDFKERSFDAVLMLRVIEHMDKKEGEAMIRKCSRWAGKKVIIIAPNGYLPQDEFDSNPFLKHRSAWSVNDFISAGFIVYGINGWKKLRGYRGLPRIRPRLVGELVSDITQKMTFDHPHLAFQLLAIKNISNHPE